MTYHVTGLISTLVFLLTIGGLWSQLELIWRRRRNKRMGSWLEEQPTAILSLNQFVSSYFAFFSFFLYGACLDRFNHYLVWPRLLAALLTLAVLYEINRDRRDFLPSAVFSGCLGLLVVVSGIMLFNPEKLNSGRILSQGLVVVVTVVLAQGYLHQVILIRRTGRTGAVSLRLHQFFFLKDVSTICFSLAMGLTAGWPLLLLSGTSSVTKLATMWQFRWVRLSSVAQQRRTTARSTPGLEIVSA